jgi:hypothetical protein
MKPLAVLLWVTLASGAARADAFDAMKRLAGVWEGKSTKGWTERQVVRVIARGSAVLFTTEFTGAGGEGMATVYHRDGKALVVTHYCEAGNQPTLELVKESPDGATLEFAFVRGTGMASRDVGHMDRLILHFIDGDRYTERWTWYQDGKEKWLEDATYRRVGTGP